MTLHVSDGSFAHHQEHKIVHTVSVIVKPLLLPAAIVDEMEEYCAPDDGRRKRLKNTEQFIEINKTRKCILLVVL
jgi:hypothetical protein